MKNFLKNKYYKAMNGQDRWVANEIFDGKKNGFFIEMGSLDGIINSNTYALEKLFEWNGICVEPIPEKYKELIVNRDCYCSNVCIDGTTDKVDFIIKEEAGHSGIVSNDTRNKPIKDAHIKENLVKSGKIIEVKAMSLIELCNNFNAPKIIDYLSVDVEGAEDRVFYNFDFKKYIFLSMTIEKPSLDLHNTFLKNNYKFIKKYSADNYYVHKLLEYNQKET